MAIIRLSAKGTDEIMKPVVFRVISKNGNLLVIHCASGSLNGVVITGSSGFVTIARPRYYTGSYQE